jgi:hypothetical protein
MHLAQINVATALYDLDDERMADFMDSLDRVNALAEATPGFVWRLQSSRGNATDIKVSDNPRFIVNMSVWESVPALFEYVFRSDHRNVMTRRRNWFHKPECPYAALWWIEEGALPTIDDGLARLSHLARHGSTPYAFTFRTVFPPGIAGPLDLKPEAYCVGWA